MRLQQVRRIGQAQRSQLGADGIEPGGKFSHVGDNALAVALLAAVGSDKGVGLKNVIDRTGDDRLIAGKGEAGRYRFGRELGDLSDVGPDRAGGQRAIAQKRKHRRNHYLGNGVLTPSGQRKAVEGVLAVLAHPELRADSVVSSLGPGPRQLVEIGRALLGNARLVVLDEPTSSLSAAESVALDGVLARLRERGVAIVYITHFLEEVMRLADRHTVLRDGRTVSTRE